MTEVEPIKLCSGPDLAHLCLDLFIYFYCSLLVCYFCIHVFILYLLEGQCLIAINAAISTQILFKEKKIYIYLLNY